MRHLHNVVTNDQHECGARPGDKPDRTQNNTQGRAAHLQAPGGRGRAIQSLVDRWRIRLRCYFHAIVGLG